MTLNFNDGRKVEVQSVSAAGGVMTVRLLNQSSDALKGIFGDELAIAVIKATDDHSQPTVYKGYVQLVRITEYTGGIWEVELRQEGADDATRIATLETDMTDVQMALADLYEMMEV